MATVLSFIDARPKVSCQVCHNASALQGCQFPPNNGHFLSYAARKLSSTNTSDRISPARRPLAECSGAYCAKHVLARLILLLAGYWRGQLSLHLPSSPLELFRLHLGPERRRPRLHGKGLLAFRERVRPPLGASVGSSRAAGRESVPPSNCKVRRRAKEASGCN
jgi:hypothetical protein